MELQKAIYRHRKLHPRRCFYCGCALEDGKKTVDHVVPRSMGRRKYDVNSNKVPACAPCNHTKANMGLEEFRNKVRGIRFFFETGKELLLWKDSNK